MSKLIAAVQVGDIEQVKKIVEESELIDASFIDEKDSLGMTSLMWACAAGRVDIAAYLLEHKANVNLRAHSMVDFKFIAEGGKTALIFACSHGSIELVRLLLSYKADASIYTAASFSALTIAADSGKLEVIKLLVESCSNIDVNMKSYAFYHASINNHLEALQYLRLQGAEVNVLCGAESSLISAAKCGSLDLVKLLLDMGAEVNIRAKSGVRPLLVALRNGREDVAELLINRGALDCPDHTGFYSLMLAARNGELSVVKLLLNKKFLSSSYINFKNADGQSAMMFALQNGYEEVVRFLLERGASIHDRDNEGRGGVMFAAQSGNIELVKLVVHQGCEINLVDRYGNSPLMLAVAKDQIEIAKLLIECGASMQSVLAVMARHKLSDEMGKLVFIILGIDDILDDILDDVSVNEIEFGIEYVEVIANRIIYRLTKTTRPTNTKALEEYLTKYSSDIAPEIVARVQEAVIVYKASEVLYSGAPSLEPLPTFSEEMIEKICKRFDMIIEKNSLDKQNFDLMREAVEKAEWPEVLAKKITDIIEAQDLVESEIDDEDWPPYSGGIEGSDIIAHVITSLRATSEHDSILAGEVDSMV